ncbi:MAG: hypothetical protein JSS07_06415 [Proteobacteria bacterium]|nr:hypothetical protein [Pseudomonadota bacterium]
MHILLITAAPKGTLGDPTLCKSAIEAIKSKYPNVEITLMIRDIPKQGIAKVNNLFKGMSGFTIHYQTAQEHFGTFKASQINSEPLFQQKYDLILAMPFSVLDNETLRAIYDKHQKGVPVALVTNYNTDLTYELKNRSDIITSLPFIMLGFGQDMAGIFLPLKSISEQKITLNDDFLKSMSKDEVKLLNFICNGTRPEFLANNDLYFSYQNKIPMVDISQFSVKDFIELCLENSKKDNITICLNAGSGKDAAKELNINNLISDLTTQNKHFSALCKNIVFEYWEYDEKNQNWNLSIKKSAQANNTKTCRLINPFPLSGILFQTLLDISNPLTMQTGNSSFVEALIKGKIPIYQVTVWSKEFILAFQQYVKQHEPNSYFCDFLQMIHKQSSAAEKQKICQFYNKHQDEMTQEIKILKDKMYSDTKLDLKSNLISELENISIDFSNLPPYPDVNSIDPNDAQAVKHMLSQLLFDRRDFKLAIQWITQNRHQVPFMKEVKAMLAQWQKNLVKDDLSNLHLDSNMQQIHLMIKGFDAENTLSDNVGVRNEIIQQAPIRTSNSKNERQSTSPSNETKTESSQKTKVKKN